MSTMTSRELGRELADAIGRKGWTNREFSRRMPVDSTLISKWVHGHKEMTHYQIRRAVAVLDDFRFSLAAARYVSGGVLGSTLDAVDGGLAAVTLCVGKEIREMSAALDLAREIVITPPAAHEREQALEVTLNLLELVAACKEMVARMCEDYEFPVSLLAAQLPPRLKAQGYVTKTSRPLARTA